MTLEAELRARRGAFLLDARFSAGPGLTALFGPSGAGKSTLLAALAGLVKAERAHVRLAGARIDTLAPERRGLGLVFQDGRLFPHLSVRANLAYGLRRRRGRAGPSLDEALDLLDLGPLAGRRPATLSGGEARRVALGRALLAAPRLLLLDEPFAGVDAGRRERLSGYLERLKAALGLPMLLVSHDVDEVLRLADETVLLHEGRVRANGPTEAVFSRFELRALAGGDSGAAVAAVALDHDAAYGLNRLAVGHGRLFVAGPPLPEGARLRLRIRARDVALFLAPPEGSSMLNRLAGRVVELARGPEGEVDVALDVGVPLWARITARSADELGLRPGMTVHAAIKTVAIGSRAPASP